MDTLKRTTRRNDALLLALGLAAGALLFAAMEAELIGPFWKLNLIIICINVVLSSSLNLINGYTGQFSLGHAGFMAVGAYVSVVMTANFGLPLPAAMAGAGLGAALLGFLIGLPTLRLNGDYLAIATLGMGEIVRIVLMNVEYVGGAAGFTGIPHLTTFPWVFGTMLLTLMFLKNFVNSAHGRACIAIRENEIAAAAMGINATRYKVLAFSLGAMFAGVAGALFAHCFYIINPTSFTFMQSFNYLIMVVLGGLGSLTGSVAGAFVVTALSALLADIPEFRMIIYSLALILLMFYRPQGLFGYVELTAFRPFDRLLAKGGGPR